MHVLFFSPDDEEEDEDEEEEEDEDDEEEEEDVDEEEEEAEKESDQKLREREEKQFGGKVMSCLNFSSAWCFFLFASLCWFFFLLLLQKLNVKVTAGTVKVENKSRVAEREKNEEKRLAIMMMKKKEKYLYNKIMFGKKRKVREVRIN